MTLSKVEFLVRKHRLKGILVDTNLLLLFLIGIFDEGYIVEFKRTKKFNIDDYYIVRKLLKPFKKIIITPQILSELSNLSQGINEPKLSKYYSYLMTIIEKSDEIYVNKNELLDGKLLPRFGFTDLSILESVKEHKYLVFTDEFALHGYLDKHKFDVINLNEIRTDIWLNK